jgi:subtilisin family serine protease
MLMAHFAFLRAGLCKINPFHLKSWLLLTCIMYVSILCAQNNQFYPNRIWVKVLSEQNAPTGSQSIQTPNNVINSVLNNYNIVYFQKAFPWSNDSVVSTFYEIYCNCNIDDLIADINQNLQGLIIHPKKLPLPEFMNYNPEDELWQLTLLDPNQYLWHLLNIQAPQAWNITIGNPNIKIAVVDNFIDATHPDLQSKLLTNADPLTGQAYTVPTSNLSVYDHGTAVSGFAAAQTTPSQGNQPQGADYASIGFNSSLIFYELGHVPSPFIPSPIWGITGLQKASHASYIMCADVISI